MRTAKTAIFALFLASALAAATVPTPESHFGHKIGADRTVLDWSRVVSYFRALERSSDRIQVAELGKTGLGRPLIAAIIAAPETLRGLDRFRQIQGRLADPRTAPPEEAERLIAQGKAVVMITCSIHANEIASTHAAVEFAYKLLTDANPRYRAILENTIFLLVPSLNPDGVDIMTAWYRKTLGTAFEGTSPPEPYNKYIGHDNNRDWYIFSQPETRLVVSKLHNIWHPQIVYDVHQQGPYASRMFVPPWMDPIEPNIDPLLVQECNMIGMGMAADLTAAGKTGVVVNALYDFWTPARHYQAYHGGMRILSESASARIASPITVRPDQILQSSQGYDPRRSSWNYLQPWVGGEWKLRDIIDDQLIAMESCLHQAAVRREDLLRVFYTIQRRAATRQTPYAFVIPAEQRDPGATKKMLETLAFGLVEIERALAPFEADGKKYPAGTFVIRMQQPYSGFAKTLLERQHYPDLRLYPGGPPKRPYDVTAHTLPLLIGVEVDTIEAPFAARLSKAAEYPVRCLTDGELPASDTDSWKRINRAWRSGAQVWRNPTSGEFFLHQAANATAVPQPRIGLYRSYVPEIDEGWTRWLFDEFGFAYTELRNPDIQAGGLRDRFDVIVFPDQPPSSITGGYTKGSMPEEYTGGLGATGAAGLREFAAQGGTIIFLNRSGMYGVRALGLPVRNLLEGVADAKFYCPGSILNARLEPGSRLAAGLPRDIAVWFENGPAWELMPGANGSVIAAYPSTGVLASGWLLGESRLARSAAVVELRVGAGRAVLFGIRPQYRAQSYQTFKLLFNALLPL